MISVDSMRACFGKKCAIWKVRIWICKSGQKLLLVRKVHRRQITCCQLVLLVCCSPYTLFSVIAEKKTHGQEEGLSQNNYIRWPTRHIWCKRFPKQPWEPTKSVENCTLSTCIDVDMYENWFQSWQWPVACINLLLGYKITIGERWNS